MIEVHKGINLLFKGKCDFRPMIGEAIFLDNVYYKVTSCHFANEGKSLILFVMVD